VIQIATLTTINRIMFGDCKEFECEETKDIQSIVRDFSDSLNPLFDIFPLLASFPPFKGQIENLQPRGVRFETFLMNKIDECIKKEDDSNNFVQKFIQLSDSTGYNVKELAFVLRDMYVAGTETLATVVACALAILCNRPEILGRLQKEIDSVVPKDRLPSLHDKSSLPYLEATLLEVMRFRTVLPMSLPHRTTCDTSVGGFTIPEDTMVIINLWSAHMDPKVWKDPETFRPERFL